MSCLKASSLLLLSILLAGSGCGNDAQTPQSDPSADSSTLPAPSSSGSGGKTIAAGGTTAPAGGDANSTGGGANSTGGTPGEGGQPPTGGSKSETGGAAPGVGGSSAGGSGVGGSSTCNAGEVSCQGDCIDPMNDAAHCGTCNSSCETSCKNGVCEEESAGCPTGLEGWAQVSGDSLDNTTGGGSLTPDRPQTAEELIEWASDDQPRVIEVEGTFSVPRLQINSNKTLIGIGDDATLNGGIRIRGSSSEPVSNVIVRNLHINGADSDVDGDAFQIYFAHHVWVDHCDIYDGPDGNLDMTHAVNWVTVSWTLFRYTAKYQPDDGETGDHRFSNLIGHSDNNASEDRGRLKITFHHNHWGDGVIERMPRVRFGQVHSFNNYFTSDDTNYCLRAGFEAHILSESNYFLNQRNTHQFNNAADETNAHITTRNNIYDGSQGTDELTGGGLPYESGYTADIDDPADIPALVSECVGPR